MPLLLVWLCGGLIMEITLNLIPPQKKEEIVKKNLFKKVLRTETFLAMIVLIFFMMLFSFRYILDFNANSQVISREKEEKFEQYEKIKKYDERFTQTNNEIKDIRNIKRDQFYWSKFLAKISGIIFPGIEIGSFSNSDYVISLIGSADTRENLILFKEKLEKDDCFSEVNLPLSDLIGKNDVEFQIDFNIKSECLKNK